MDQAERQKIEMNTFSRSRPRYFNTGLEQGKFEQVDDGLLVRDVILLAEGTWTDSNVRTPCHYSADVLKKYASNWKDNGVWSRHPGGSPRSVADKIGTVINCRYDPEHRAIVGDLLFHRRNQMSRDIADMVQTGLVNAVSVEIGGEEYYNRKTKMNEAVSIDGYGVAIVDRGACDVCLIRHKSAPETASNDADNILTPDKGGPGESPEEGVEIMDEEIRKILDDLAARVAALEEKLAPSEEEEEASPEDEISEEGEKEMAAKLDAIVRELEDARMRLKLLENSAKPTTQMTGGQSRSFEKRFVGKLNE